MHVSTINVELSALAQTVACLPLVQQVRGSIPGVVVNFNLKIFNLGARMDGDVHFLIARLVCMYVCMYVEKAYNTVDSDSSVVCDVKPGGPLGAFREEQAMSRHRASPSPFLSSSSHTSQ